jgi:hypothetical protein
LSYFADWEDCLFTWHCLAGAGNKKRPHREMRPFLITR